MYGVLLAGVYKAIITVPTQLHHFPHCPCIACNLIHIYLGQSVALYMIPSVANAVHLLHHPLLPIEQSTPFSPLPNHVQAQHSDQHGNITTLANAYAKTNTSV